MILHICEWYDAMVEPDWIIDFMYDELYTEDPGPCGFDNWFNPAVELPDMHDGVTPEMIEKVFGSVAPQGDGAQGEDKGTAQDGNLFGTEPMS